MSAHTCVSKQAGRSRQCIRASHAMESSIQEKPARCAHFVTNHLLVNTLALLVEDSLLPWLPYL